MAKKKDEGSIFPNGVHFGIVQLERDILPSPPAQRIVQWVNRNGKLKAYISANAYMKSELFPLFDKLVRMSYAGSISHGSVALIPVRTRINWFEFTEDFLKGGDGYRINPETDEEEVTPIPEGLPVPAGVN